MLIAFWFLLLMYVGLCVLYAYEKPELAARVEPWPLLPTAPPKSASQQTAACEDDSECPPHHVCLGNACVPKLLRDGDCTLPYGQWISYDKKGITFAVCSCTQDQLFTQNVFGGDCTVNVGCGVHGIFREDRCECDPGYVAEGLTCRKLPVLETLVPDEFDDDVSVIRGGTGFHADYDVAPAKFVRKPCTFDALSGRPLRHAFHDPEWGCVCDPRYGLFGVVLDGSNKTYLSTEGYDACASVFEDKDPQDPIEVRLVTYFYLGEREPVSLILFENLIKKKDAAASENLMVRQHLWRYDYAQYFFRTHPKFHARLRKLYLDPVFKWETINDAYYVDDFAPGHCAGLSYHWRNDKASAYRLLYANPVCFVPPEGDAVADPAFHDRYVLNPLHLTFDHFQDLPRFNAFVLRYDATVGIERWTLDLDYSLNVDLYRNIPTNAPDYGL